MSDLKFPSALRAALSTSIITYIKDVDNSMLKLLEMESMQNPETYSSVIKAYSEWDYLIKALDIERIED